MVKQLIPPTVFRTSWTNKHSNSWNIQTKKPFKVFFAINANLATSSATHFVITFKSTFLLQAWTFALGMLGRTNFWGAQIFWACTICLEKKENSFNLQIFCQRDKQGKSYKKFYSNKYCQAHQCTNNISVFSYLMMSKLIYLLKDWEIFH